MIQGPLKSPDNIDGGACLSWRSWSCIYILDVFRSNA